MPVYISLDHPVHYPVGGASVVVAPDEATARQLLDAELVKHGLEPDSRSPYTLERLNTRVPAAHVLRDGNY
jgi:hypothetical protein